MFQHRNAKTGKDIFNNVVLNLQLNYQSTAQRTPEGDCNPY